MKIINKQQQYIKVNVRVGSCLLVVKILKSHPAFSALGGKDAAVTTALVGVFAQQKTPCLKSAWKLILSTSPRDLFSNIPPKKEYNNLTWQERNKKPN